jgi:amidase
MAIRRPTQGQVAEMAERLGMTMDADEVAFFHAAMDGIFARYDAVEAMEDPIPAVKWPRTPGYRPGPAENPFGAWYWKTDIKGAKKGPLSGKRVAVKDNVMVAGVPMMNGASTLEGFVPDVDATIVARMLDAGATIVGKATCEYFCLSGGSHTSSPGPVHNPRKPGYSAGGSSSGSGALLVTGEADMTIGGDQGGSIRMPAAYCGVYGMKPTHGLVPYTGVMPIEVTIDHTGPMTSTVADNALLLEVLAGPDGYDPRQQAAAKAEKYTAALGKGVAGMKIGVVKQGFGRANSEKDVDASVKDAAKRLKKLGAEVEEVSIPMHDDGTAIWTPIALEGLQWQMMLGNGYGMNYKGLYSATLIDAHANWRSRADELSDSLKVSMFAGQWGIDAYRGRFYAKCRNLAYKLTAAYDAALAGYDLLLMPTLPIKATRLPDMKNKGDVLARAFEMLENTCPFDVTGHPAMAVPCGMGDGLPISMMLVGKKHAESTIYRAAHAFEQAGDWTKW